MQLSHGSRHSVSDGVMGYLHHTNNTTPWKSSCMEILNRYIIYVYILAIVVINKENKNHYSHYVFICQRTASSMIGEVSLR